MKYTDLRRRLRSAATNRDPKASVRRLLRQGADRQQVTELLSDLSYGAKSRKQEYNLLEMLRTAENYQPQAMTRRAVANPMARQNFFGLFKSGPPEEQFDLPEYIGRAQNLILQMPRVQDYLVHAPGKRGRGRAWYWVVFPGRRAIMSARANTVPKRYIKSSSPWNDIRRNLAMYRDGQTRPFIVIDTFSGTVEGPLTLAQIEGRQNPEKSRYGFDRPPRTKTAGSNLTAKELGFSPFFWNDEEEIEKLSTDVRSFNERRKARRALMQKNPRRGLARPNESRLGLDALAESMERLISQLQDVKVGAQLAHWNSHGPNGYANHLLYERIYKKMDKYIDTLAEKYVSYIGKPVPASAMMTNIVSGADPEVDFDIEKARDLSDGLRVTANTAYEMKVLYTNPSGLDDFLMSLNNKLDTFYYLVTKVQPQ